MDREYIILNDVLFILHSAKLSNWQRLNNISIQRVLYFCSILSPIAQIDWNYGFTNSFIGPFNGEVSNSLKKLVLNHYVEIKNNSVQSDLKVRGEYLITDAGKNKVEKITQLKNEKNRLSWINTVIQVLDIYGPRVVAKIILYEPNFLNSKLNKQREIDVSYDNLSLLLLNNIKNELEKHYSIDLDTQTSKVIAFFDYLSNDIGK